MTIGEKIKQIRLGKGLTQKQLGDICGMADSAIRRYENNRATPKFETIKRIAEALEVDYWEIIGFNNITIPLNQENPDEQQLLHKYRHVDDMGKHTIDTVVDIEYNRCNKHKEENK